MPTINITPIEDDAEAVASVWNTRFDTIVDLLNGNLDADNIANLGITTAKLANGAVTNAKVADTSIGPEKMQNPLAFLATQDTQALSASTWTKAQCDTEIYDYGEDYDNATNYRYTAPVDGVYHFSGSCSFSGSERMIVEVRKNGADEREYRGTDILVTTATGAKTSTVATDMYLDAGEYAEFWVWSDDAVDAEAIRFSGHLVGQVEV